MKELTMSEFTTLDHHRIAYYDTGETNRTPIILAHGFPFHHKMWAEQISLLEKDYRIIAYDMRGLGKSSNHDNFFTMEVLSNDMLELINHLNLKTVIGLGLSMGGYVLLRAHEKAPEKFSGLILADTQTVAESDEAKIKRSATIELIKQKGLEPFADAFLKNAVAKSENIEKLRPMIINADINGVLGALMALITRTDTTKSLRKITVPTLIIVGEKDSITPPDAALAMHEEIPLSEMKILKQAGHLSNLDNPLDFNTALSEFLEKNKKTFIHENVT